MLKKTIFVFNGVITNDLGEVLIGNRNEKDLPSANQKWGLPGGRIKFGETPEEAVVRETMEETGCIVEILGMIPITHTDIWHYSNKEQHTVIFGYYGKALETYKGHRNDRDINQVKWISPRELNEYDFLPGVLKMIKYVIGQN